MLVALGAVFPDLTYHPWVSEDVSQTNPVQRLNLFVCIAAGDVNENPL